MTATEEQLDERDSAVDVAAVDAPPAPDVDAVVAHEHYPARGGGEVVADTLADVFDAPVVTGWLADADYSTHDPTELLADSPANVLRSLFGNPLVRDLFYMFAWESAPPLRDHDVILQSGNAPTWYVPDTEQTIVKYVHSPPRNPFDLFWRETAETAGWRQLLQPGYVADRLYKKAARQLWKNRTDAVDVWVCNSEVVAKRTRKYLGVPDEKIRVVYPPVAVDDYEPRDGGDYLLFLSRLAPSKHVGTAIEAVRGTDHELVIAGDGAEREVAEQAAATEPNITYRGYVPDDEKRELLQGARGLVFLAEQEDFGMVPVEAMAAGTPVIGVAEGFTKYQLRGGGNGLLVEREADDVRAAADRLRDDGVAWDAAELHAFAAQFSEPRFAAEMQAVVQEAVNATKLEVQLRDP
ncbi:glycosyltransferase [Halonotius terrestris]|uniref:Glycosyltransferase n=1 Tax=Halonotius terrestris TaxID=2487750 RepID=A0A8J8P776_9EURY|nr:glycosyltransferase [Halonotius terrestris]